MTFRASLVTSARFCFRWPEAHSWFWIDPIREAIANPGGHFGSSSRRCRPPTSPPQSFAYLRVAISSIRRQITTQQQFPEVQDTMERTPRSCLFLAFARRRIESSYSTRHVDASTHTIRSRSLRRRTRRHAPMRRGWVLGVVAITHRPPYDRHAGGRRPTAAAPMPFGFGEGRPGARIQPDRRSGGGLAGGLSTGGGARMRRSRGVPILARWPERRRAGDAEAACRKASTRRLRSNIRRRAPADCDSCAGLFSAATARARARLGPAAPASAARRSDEIYTERLGHVDCEKAREPRSAMPAGALEERGGGVRMKRRCCRCRRSTRHRLEHASDGAAHPGGPFSGVGGSAT